MTKPNKIDVNLDAMNERKMEALKALDKALGAYISCEACKPDLCDACEGKRKDHSEELKDLWSAVRSAHDEINNPQARMDFNSQPKG